MSLKIDSTGKYLPFAGLTVVADVFQLNAELFLNFHRKLSEHPLIVEYNGLLPAESYHITTFSVIEQNFEDWTDAEFYHWLRSKENLLRRTHQELEAHTKGFPFRLSVDKRRLTLYADIDKQAAEDQLAVAQATGFVSRIPHRFHISLGYEFKKLQSNEIRTRIHEAVVNILNECLPDYQNVILYAFKPKLCYYHSMTEFIPWDGRGNPFTGEKEWPVMGARDGLDIKTNSAGNDDLDELVTFEG